MIISELDGQKLAMQCGVLVWKCLTLVNRIVSAGGSYALFAGKECARALGKMTMDAKDCTAEVSDLSEAQLKTLSDWEEKFHKKYDQVGTVR